MSIDGFHNFWLFFLLTSMKKLTYCENMKILLVTLFRKLVPSFRLLAVPLKVVPKTKTEYL
jgi:hypothetical protein